MLHRSVGFPAGNSRTATQGRTESRHDRSRNLGKPKGSGTKQFAASRHGEPTKNWNNGKDRYNTRIVNSEECERSIIQWQITLWSKRNDSYETINPNIKLDKNTMICNRIIFNLKSNRTELKSLYRAKIVQSTEYTAISDVRKYDGNTDKSIVVKLEPGSICKC